MSSDLMTCPYLAEQERRPVQAVFFDFGGVLSPPLDTLFDLYAGKSGVSAAALKAAMAAVGRDLGAPPLAHIELGLITEAEWGSRLRDHLEAAGQDAGGARLEEFGQQWFDGVVANAAMVEAAADARARGLAVGVLSNNVVEWEPYWHDIIATAGPFDAVVDSCRVGVRKPDPEIFRLAQAAVGVEAAGCVLVDDLAENCASAREVGWGAVQFLDDQQARADLDRLLDQPDAVTVSGPSTTREVHHVHQH